jgi:hypothetical protein
MDSETRKELRAKEVDLQIFIEAYKELIEALQSIKASKADAKLHK